MKPDQIIMNCLVVACLAGLCGCKPKNDVASLMEDFGSGKIERIKRAGDQLVIVIQREPETVRKAVKANSTAGAWIVTTGIAADHEPTPPGRLPAS